MVCRAEVHLSLLVMHFGGLLSNQADGIRVATVQNAGW